MISLDRTLLGADYSGDVLERHKEYAKLTGQLDIIVFSKKGFKKKKINENLTIYPTNSRIKLNYILDAYETIRSIYWPDKFDLVVCQDPFLAGLVGWIIKKRFKVPLLVHFHGDFWQNKYWLIEAGRWWFNWFFLLLSIFIVKRSDGIRVVSSGIKDKLVKKGINKRKIKVIPTPVDLEKFVHCDPVKVKKLRSGDHSGRKALINVGRKDPSKDYKTLYKAIGLVYQDYKKLAFWQIGSNEYLPEKIKADQNLVLTSTDKISQEELSNYYHASNIYISSSCSESFGKVLIEAMAAGLPVIATETTGSKEIIKNGENGFLVPIGDSDALAKKISFLLNDPEKAKEMGQAGRKIVRGKFNQEKITKKMIRFWKELIKK